MQKLLVVATLIAIFNLCCTIGSYQYVPPPTTFQEADLVGTWQGHYYNIEDTLVIKKDGTYQQTAKNSQFGFGYLYYYQSDWNNWYIERRASGTFRVHFEKMVYYGRGLTSNGHAGYVPVLRDIHFGLYDPVEEVFVPTTDEVVLRVEGTEDTNFNGKVILCQMADDPDSVVQCFRLVK